MSEVFNFIWPWITKNSLNSAAQLNATRHTSVEILSRQWPDKKGWVGKYEMPEFVTGVQGIPGMIEKL